VKFVGAIQAQVIAGVLGESHGVPEIGQPLVGAAAVGEVDAEHGERSHLGRGRAGLPGQRERLVGERQRLRVASGDHQPARERPERVRPLR
jgi:hypothetical protein